MYNKNPKKSQPNPYITALAETLLIAVFTMLPSIFGFLRTIVDTNSLGFQELYKSGEFFLYAVSFLGSSFLVYNNFKLRQSWMSIFGIIIIIFVLLFSILYTVTSYSENPKYETIKYLSIFSLVIAIPFFYYSQVINNQPSSPNVVEQRQEEQQIIQDGLK